jgi:uncharacterized protein
MHKFLITFLLTFSCGTAFCAEGLADAAHAYDNRHFIKAARIYTRLANVGNAEAQVKLAMMYQDGVGVESDLGKSEFWFAKAQAQGNTQASAALHRIRERNSKKEEIAYFTTAYDGHALRAKLSECTIPQLPAVSKDNTEIERVEKHINTWTECFNQFVVQMNGTQPVGREIPATLSSVMSEAELVKAKTLMEATYSKIFAEAEAKSKQVESMIATWSGATKLYVQKKNKDTVSKQDKFR